MKKINHRKWSTAFILGLLLALIYLRENMLLGINAFLNERAFGNKAYYFWVTNYFSGMSKETLIKFKWLTTGSFSVLMAGLTIFALHNWFRNNDYTRLLLYLYGLGALIIAVVTIVAQLFGVFDSVYRLLRTIIGINHTPLPFFIFFSLFYWIEKE